MDQFKTINNKSYSQFINKKTLFCQQVREWQFIDCKNASLAAVQCYYCGVSPPSLSSQWETREEKTSDGRLGAKINISNIELNRGENTQIHTRGRNLAFNFFIPSQYNSANFKYKIGNDCQFGFHINNFSARFRMFYVF